jgi:hypothetical protein
VDSDRRCPPSYRRGKPETNDIDIVITHAKADQKRIQELCQELTDVLSKKGLVTHLMSDSESPRYIISHNTHEIHKCSTHRPKYAKYVSCGRHCEGSNHLLPSGFQQESQIGPDFRGAGRVLDSCRWMVGTAFEDPR